MYWRGLSSRLFQEIRERRGLAYSVWSERVAYHDAGTLSVGLGTAPEHVPEVLDIVFAELARLGADGVTERELTIAKGNLRAETLLAAEDSGARMSRIGASLLLHGEILSVDEVLARIEALHPGRDPRRGQGVGGRPANPSVVGPSARTISTPMHSVSAERSVARQPLDHSVCCVTGRSVRATVGWPPCESGWSVQVARWAGRSVVR